MGGGGEFATVVRDCSCPLGYFWQVATVPIGDIDFFNNGVIMSSVDTNLNSSTAQEIVNWVTTADGCVHTADTT